MSDTDQAKLNRQIATLLGWTDIGENEANHLLRWSKHPDGQYAHLPDYCGDYDTSLHLLETCLSNPLVAAITIFQTRDGLWRSDLKIRLSFDAATWHDIDGDETQTLPLAIAISCRDALNALRGDTDDGTNA